METQVATPEDPHSFEASLEAVRALRVPIDPITGSPADGTDVPQPAHTPETPASVPVASDAVTPRIRAFMEREQRLLEKELALKETEQKYNMAAQQLSLLQEAQTRLARDPAAYIRSIAPDLKPAEIAKAIWQDELGDLAPIEYKATKEARTALMEVERLRAELNKRDSERSEATAQQQAQAEWHQYTTHLSAFADAPPAELPLVRAYASADREQLADDLLRMARKYASDPATYGQAPTAEICGRMLEEKLRRYEAAKTPVAVPTQPTSAPSRVPAKPVSSLFNKHSTVQPSLEAPDPLDDEVLRARAIAAVRRFEGRE